MNKDDDDSLAILPGTSFTIAVTVNYIGGNEDRYLLARAFSRRS